MKSAIAALITHYPTALVMIFGRALASTVAVAISDSVTDSGAFLLTQPQTLPTTFSLLAVCHNNARHAVILVIF